MNSEQTQRLPSLPPPLEPRSQSNGKPATTKPKGKPNRKAAGRFAMLNAFVDRGARTIDTTAAAVWLVIYREVQPDGSATVSHQRIAECLNIDRKTATRAVARLESAGLARVVRRGGWRRGPSTYRLRGSATKATPKRPDS